MTDFSTLKPGESVLIAPLSPPASGSPQWLTVTKCNRKYAYLPDNLRIDRDSGQLFDGSKWLPYHGIFCCDADYRAATRTRQLAIAIAARCQSATRLAELDLARLEQIASLLELDLPARSASEASGTTRDRDRATSSRIA